MKSVWLTSLERSEESVRKVAASLSPYGIAVKGHFWTDDLANMAWMGPREEMIRAENAAWLLLASAETLGPSSVRRGLSLLALTVQGKKGLSFPVIFLAEQGAPAPAPPFPTPLKGAQVLAAADPTTPAKIVAAVHVLRPEPEPEYRVDTYGTRHAGLWFEVGPRRGRWEGALFGACGADIVFHGTGPKEMLPAQCVLEYPVKGMKLSLGGREYTAWGVRNAFDEKSSYFVKVGGCPESILFGPFPEEGEEAEFFTVHLT